MESFFDQQLFADTHPQQRLPCVNEYIGRKHLLRHRQGKIRIDRSGTPYLNEYGTRNNLAFISKKL